MGKATITSGTKNWFEEMSERRRRDDYYEHLDIDPFGVTQEEGRFDLSDAQTAYLSEQGLSDEQMESIETQYIDEIYGTTDGQTVDESGADLGLSQSEWQATYFDDQGAIAQNEASSIWGLDLRRTMLDEDGGEITSSHPEYYEHLTRGEVDWASYQEDPKYIEAFNNMGGDLNDGERVKLEDLTTDQYTDEERAEFIRKANVEIATPWEPEMGDNKDKDHLDWEKYDKDKVFRDKTGDLWMKDENGVAQKQPTLKDLWTSNDPAGRLKVNKAGKHTDILQRRKVGRPTIPGVTWTATGKGWDKPSLTNPSRIKLPRNIRGLLRGGSGS